MTKRAQLLSRERYKQTKGEGGTAISSHLSSDHKLTSNLFSFMLSQSLVGNLG